MQFSRYLFHTSRHLLNVVNPFIRTYILSTSLVDNLPILMALFKYIFISAWAMCLRHFTWMLLALRDDERRSPESLPEPKLWWWPLTATYKTVYLSRFWLFRPAPRSASCYRVQRPNKGRSNEGGLARCWFICSSLKMGLIEHPHTATHHDYPGVRQMQQFSHLKGPKRKLGRYPGFCNQLEQRRDLTGWPRALVNSTPQLVEQTR